MLNVTRSGKWAGEQPRDAGGTRSDLDPEESNRFGPDAPNVREDDPLGGQVIPETRPSKPPEKPLDHGDFAPDEG
jgi:hypothetical protein